MKYITTFFLIVMAIAISGCSSTGIKNNASQTDQNTSLLINNNELPVWLIKAMNNNPIVNSSSPFVVKELNVNSSVIGNLTSSEKVDNYWYFTIDIGSVTPVECYSFSSYDGAANAFNRMSSAFATVLAEGNNKPLLETISYSIGAGNINEIPYLSHNQLVVLGPKNQQTIGLIKGYAAESNETLQTCFHTEVGYQKAFQAVFESFVRAFSESHNLKQPLFKSIYQMRLNNMIMGYGYEEMTIDKDGDVKILEGTTSIMPITSDSLSVSDSVQISWSKPNGALINTYEHTIENNEMASQYNLRRENNLWSVKGQLQGKEINQDLEYKGEINSSLSVYQAVKQLKAPETNSRNLVMWISEADPTTTTNATISTINDNPNANVNFIMGPLSMNVLSDENGITRNADMEVGPVKVKINTIYSQGSPYVQ